VVINVNQKKLAMTLCVVFLISLPGHLYADFQINSATDDTGVWTNSAFARDGVDDTYATSSTDGQINVYYNYGFNITVEITMVEVGGEYYTDDGDDRIFISVSTDTGASWSTEQQLTAKNPDDDVIEWLDFTSAFSWTPDMLTDANFRVKVRMDKAGGPGPVYLDSLPVRVSFPGPTPIYRSVGPGKDTALASGSGANELTITGSLAEFTGTIPDNVGVGDAIQYGNDTEICFIHGRNSSSEYVVKNSAGGIAVSTASDTTWSIYRAYTSLARAEGGNENDGLVDTLEDFDNWSGGKDLVANYEQWNIACYANEATAEASNVTIDGWTTSTNTYIRIYTPVSLSEVGESQRHNGKWDDTKYLLEVLDNYPENEITVREEFVRIEGLQILWANTWYSVGYGIRFSIGSPSDVRISHNIIKADTSALAYTSGISIGDVDDITIKIWNNIVYGATSGGIVDGTYVLGGAPGNTYVYNNTVYNCGGTGIGGRASSGRKITAKNNIVQNCGNGFNGDWGSGSDYNVSDLPGDTTGGSNDKAGVNVKFVDEVNDDFHLASSDTVAKDSGTALSGDDYIPFMYDIDGGTRPWGSKWDIGADEYTDSYLGTPAGLELVDVYASSITAAWDLLNDATGYTLVCSTNSTSPPVDIWSSSSTIGVNATTATVYTPELYPNTTYYMFVRAHGNNRTGSYSEYITTSTLADKVTNAVIYKVFQSSVILNWAVHPAWPSSSTCEGYIVQASAKSDFSQVYKSSTMVNIGISTLTVTGLSFGTTYWFRVGSLNWFGAANYDSFGSTRTLEGPPVDAQIDVVYVSSITMSWIKQGSPDGYVVELSTKSGCEPVYSFSGIYQGVGRSSHTVSALLSNTTYYLRAGNLFGSTTNWMKNPALYLETATLANPVDGAQIYKVFRSSVTLNWQALPESPPAPSSATCEGYIVQASTKNDFDPVYKSSSTTNVNLSTLTVIGLNPNTTYWFGVGSLNWYDTANYLSAGSTATLWADPDVSCGKSTGTWGNSPIFIFTNEAGWGAGGVEYYKYKWDKSASPSDYPDTWDIGNLISTATSEGSWYLHVKSYDAFDSGNPSTMDYGPYNYETSTPVFSNFYSQKTDNSWVSTASWNNDATPNVKINVQDSNYSGLRIGKSEMAPSTGTVLLLHMNEAGLSDGATTYDSSGYGNNGVLYGAASITTDTWKTGGATEEILYFDAKADYIELQSAISDSIITATMWYYFDGTGGTWNTLFCRDGTSYHHLLIQNLTNEIGFWNLGWYSSGYSLTQGNWYHIILIKDGTNSKIYVNGDLKQNSDSSFNNAVYPLKLIGNYGGHSQGALGFIDEVRILNRALTAEEIATNYNSGCVKYSTSGASGP
jgi:hypothetical protein